MFDFPKMNLPYYRWDTLNREHELNKFWSHAFLTDAKYQRFLFRSNYSVHKSDEVESIGFFQHYLIMVIKNPLKSVFFRCQLSHIGWIHSISYLAIFRVSNCYCSSFSVSHFFPSLRVHREKSSMWQNPTNFKADLFHSSHNCSVLPVGSPVAWTTHVILALSAKSFCFLTCSDGFAHIGQIGLGLGPRETPSYNESLLKIWETAWKRAKIPTSRLLTV